MKQDTVRLKDRADAELLRQQFDVDEKLMPVRRFRSAEEMNQPVWRDPGDPAPYRRHRRALAPRRADRPAPVPPGVHKHRSIEDVNATAESWAQAKFNARRE